MYNMNISKSLQKLARSVRFQNLFFACKELHGLKLFENTSDLSYIQQQFLTHLYNFETISKDIITEKISKRVLEDEIMWNSYFLWKQNKKEDKTKKNSNKRQDVKLVMGKTINFPKVEDK